MANFETALRRETLARPRLGLKGRRVMAVLNMRKGKRRTEILARWEAHAAAAAGVKGGVGFDWDSIDWKSLFDQIMKFLLMVLDLFA